MDERSEEAANCLCRAAVAMECLISVLDQVTPEGNVPAPGLNLLLRPIYGELSAAMNALA